MNDWLDAETRVERAQQLTESQRWDEALAELEAAIEINPNDADWHVCRGRILDELGRYEEAADSYQQARMCVDQTTEVATRLGIDLIRTGRCEEAVRLFEEVADDERDYEPAYCHRIAAYTRMGEHDKAEEMFYLAQQIDEECPHCFHHLAESLACRGQLTQALYCWRRTLEICPNYPQAHERIAQVYRAQGEHDQARQSYLAALRHDPGNTDILADLGNLMVEIEDLPAAAVKFRQVLELEPDAVLPRVMLGLIEMRSHRNEAAGDHLESALAREPDYPGLRSYLGLLELYRNNHYEALRHLTIALTHDPDDTIGLLAMGNCMLGLKRTSEAESHYRRLLDRQPDTVAALHNLAVCRFLVNDLEDGVRYCTRALRLEPTNLMVIHKLALAFIELGRWQEARGMIRRGLTQEPGHRGLRHLATRFPWLRLCHFLRHLVRRGAYVAGVDETSTPEVSAISRPAQPTPPPGGPCSSAGQRPG